MNKREQIIIDYIEAYNNLDVSKMIENLDETIQFENISNGVTTMRLTGLASFKEQAEEAKKLFTERNQTVKSLKHFENETEIEIDYRAILATDLPNGLKKGDQLKLQGKTIFKFRGDKIMAFTDIT